jgi:DNA-binding NarL/FixJ family response regulator
MPRILTTDHHAVSGGAARVMELRPCGGDLSFGDELLDTAATEQSNVALLDYTMPGANWAEITRRLRVMKW